MSKSQTPTPRSASRTTTGGSGKISSDEIAAAIDPLKHPPIMTPDQASDLLQISKHTLYRRVSEGSFKHATKRGKPLRFFRDRLIQAFFAEG